MYRTFNAVFALLLYVSGCTSACEQPKAESADKPIGIIEFPEHPIESAISYDGSMLLTAKMQLWDVVSGKRLHVLQVEGERDPVACLSFSRDGTKILVGHGPAKSNRVSIFETASGRRLHELPHHQVRVAAFSSDGKHVLTADGATMRLWSIDTGKEVRSFPHVGNSFVEAVGFSSDGTLGFSRFNHEFFRWDLKTGKEINHIEFGSPNNSYSVHFTHDGRAFATHFKGEETSVWDLKNPKPIKVMRVDVPWNIRKIADGYEWQEIKHVQVSANGKNALSTIETVRLTFKEAQRKEGGTRKIEKFTPVAWKVVLWDVEAEKIVRVISQSGLRYAFLLSGDGRTAVIGTEGNRFEVWKLK